MSQPFSFSSPTPSPPASRRSARRSSPVSSRGQSPSRISTADGRSPSPSRVAGRSPSPSRRAPASKLLPAPFPYLAAPTPPPAPQADGYTSNVHRRAEAYLASRAAAAADRAALEQLLASGVATAPMVDEPTDDHRPPNDAFDDYHEEFHAAPPSSHAGESRRQAYLRVQARARRARARAMGLLDEEDGNDSETDDEEGDDLAMQEEKSADANTLVWSSERARSDAAAARRARRREQRRAGEAAIAVAAEEERRADLDFSLLATFNNQMRAVEQAEVGKILRGVTSGSASSKSNAAAADSSAAANSRIDFGSAAVLARQHSTTGAAGASAAAAAAAAAATVSSPHVGSSLPPSRVVGGLSFGKLGSGATAPFALPIVLPGAPPFHFDPTQSAAYIALNGGSGRPGAPPKPLSRAEERRREAAFEKEKRELLSYLRGASESGDNGASDHAGPMTSSVGVPSSVSAMAPSDSPGGLKPIIEEALRNVAPRMSSPVRGARRSVGFRAPSPPRAHAPPATAAAVTPSAPAVPRAVRPLRRREWTNAADARLFASMRSVNHSSSKVNGPPLTLTLAHKRLVEKERKARRLFQQVCGGAVALHESASKTSISSRDGGGAKSARRIAREESRFGFGLHLSVEEISRNVKQEQRLIQGLAGATGANERTNVTSNFAPFYPATTRSRAPSLAISEHEADARGDSVGFGGAMGAIDETLSVHTAGTGASSSKDASARDVVPDDTKGRAPAPPVAAKDATAGTGLVGGEYTSISPALVNALLKATKRGDATMVSALIAQVSDEQRLDFINMRDKNGSTAIFHTVWPGHLSALRALLEAGADPNIQNVKRNTALHLAVERGHRSLIRCLLEYKADYTLPNFENKLCYHTPPREEDRVTMERFILNAVAEVKRGVHSSFKLDIGALTPAPENDPFDPRFYRAHGWPAAEARTISAAKQVASTQLREIMAHTSRTPHQAAAETRGTPASTTNSTRPQTSAAGTAATTSNAPAAHSITSADTPSDSIAVEEEPAVASAALDASAVDLSAAGPFFARFLRRAMKGRWGTGVSRPQGAQSAALRTERALYRRWLRAQRRATRERRRRERAERHARERAKDPLADAVTNPSTRDDDESGVGTRAQTRATTRSTNRTSVPHSDYSSPIAPTRGLISTRASLEHPPPSSPPSGLTPLHSHTQPDGHQVDREEDVFSASSDDSPIGRDESVSPSVTHSESDSDDDFAADDDEFESLLPVLPSRPKSGPRATRSRPHSGVGQSPASNASRPFSQWDASPSNASWSRAEPAHPPPPPHTGHFQAAPVGVDPRTELAPWTSGSDRVPLDAPLGFIASPDERTPSISFSVTGGPPSPDKASALASAIHADSTRLSSRSRPPAESKLSPPFHFSDDFGAQSRWVTALAPGHGTESGSGGGGGRVRSRMGAREWSRSEAHPPATVAPSVFPVGFPYATSERARPHVRGLDAPGLVARAEEMGILPSASGSPPRPTRELDEKEKEERPSHQTDGSHDHASARVGSSAWHALRYASLPNVVSQAPQSLAARAAGSFTAQTSRRPRSSTGASLTTNGSRSARAHNMPSATDSGAATPLYSSFSGAPSPSGPRTARPIIPVVPMSRPREYHFTGRSEMVQSHAVSHPLHTHVRATTTGGSVSRPRTRGSGGGGGLAVIAARFQVTPSARAAALRDLDEPTSPATMNARRRTQGSAAASKKSTLSDETEYLHPAAMIAMMQRTQNMQLQA